MTTVPGAWPKKGSKKNSRLVTSGNFEKSICYNGKVRLNSFMRYFRGAYSWLCIFFLTSYIWKLSGWAWIPGISDHLSNFALTGVLSLALIGPVAFGARDGQVKVLVTSGLFVLANLVVELVSEGALNGFNVLDAYDALYGVTASIIVVSMHFITRRPRVSI